MRSIFKLVLTLSSIACVVISASDIPSTHDKRDGTAPPPKPEPIEIVELPLPPALANTTEGACSLRVNPRGTGCIAQNGLNSRSFLPDGQHVTASVTFVGAPAAPNPASIYTDKHFILLKAGGTKFPNGDTWKCITCGVPEENKLGSTDLGEYPQTFRDGIRAISGINVIDCGTAQLASEDCTPDTTHIYPIRLSDTANDDGTGTGATLREIRLYPDNAHLTLNSFTEIDSGLGQATFFGRLQFNATVSRYGLVNVTILSDPALPPTITVNGDRMTINKSAIEVGELRGLTGTGKEIVHVGYPYESCNTDLFAADLTTGAVRRITAHPEYADPIAVSPDDQWQIVLDTRGSNRMMFLSALRAVPPITDLVTIAATASVRNNGTRRFLNLTCSIMKAIVATILARR